MNCFFFTIAATSIMLSVSCNSLCMENNGLIGTIDQLMLANSLLKQRSTLQRGYKAIKKDINKHEFKLKEWTSGTYICIDNPYCITHNCSKDDNSALSDQVFERINKIKTQEITVKVNNPLNQHPNAIDEYSYWVPTNDSNTIIITSLFYNKKILIKDLNNVFTILDKVSQNEDT